MVAAGRVHAKQGTCVQLANICVCMCVLYPRETKWPVANPSLIGGLLMGNGDVWDPGWFTIVDQQ